MNTTNLAYAENHEEIKNEDVKNIPESTWNYIVDEMKKVFRFTHKETKWFKNCKTAKLIATIPFAAGCDEPERTAIAHLCLYVAEIRGFQKYCSHQQSDNDDLYKRLGFISTFEGGNEEIIKQGMDLLALVMIEGYHKSEQKDKEAKVYNPFVSGAWDYNNIKVKLITNLQKENYIGLKDFIDYPAELWED